MSKNFTALFLFRACHCLLVLKANVIFVSIMKYTETYTEAAFIESPTNLSKHLFS